jgi:hypothetical protein
MRSWSLALYLAVAAAASVAAGVYLGNRWWLPLLNTLLAYPIYAYLVIHREYGRAVGWMLFWAFFLSVSMITLVVLAPETARAAVLRGAEYKKEMFDWIRTGQGAESDPSRFIPQHLLHYGAFAAASLLSGGALGLLMGCVLLNYMNFYVGSLIYHGVPPLTVLLYGWPVWSILRVAGFIVTAVGLSDIFFAKVLRRDGWDSGAAKKALAIGFVLIVADMMLKAFLAPIWRDALWRGFSAGAGG